jgi:hypothetical protein
MLLPLLCQHQLPQLCQQQANRGLGAQLALPQHTSSTMESTCTPISSLATTGLSTGVQSVSSTAAWKLASIATAGYGKCLMQETPWYTAWGPHPLMTSTAGQQHMQACQCCSLCPLGHS